MLPLLHTRGVSSSNLLAGTKFFEWAGDSHSLASPVSFTTEHDPSRRRNRTLQNESVQLAIFARTLAGTPDTLVGYRVIMSATEDQDFIEKSGAVHHRNLQFTSIESDIVEGTVLTITPKELEQADAYEPNDYERVLVQLNSGLKAWVYIHSRS
jgi:hypothetical protein